MKIITWNLGYWIFRQHHDEAWRYLREDICPDIALLQEVKPPELADAIVVPSGYSRKSFLSVGRRIGEEARRVIDDPLSDKVRRYLQSLRGPDDQVGGELNDVEKTKGRNRLLVNGSTMDRAEEPAVL